MGMPRGDACPGIGHLHHACLAWRYLRPIEPEYLGLTFSVGCWLLTAWCGVASLVCWRGCGCGFVVVVGVVEHSTGVFNCLPRQDPWMDEMNKRALARPGRSGPTPPQSPTHLPTAPRTDHAPAGDPCSSPVAPPPLQLFFFLFLRFPLDRVSVLGIAVGDGVGGGFSLHLLHCRLRRCLPIMAPFETFAP